MCGETTAKQVPNYGVCRSFEHRSIVLSHSVITHLVNQISKIGIVKVTDTKCVEDSAKIIMNKSRPLDGW